MGLIELSLVSAAPKSQPTNVLKLVKVILILKVPVASSHGSHAGLCWFLFLCFLRQVVSAQRRVQMHTESAFR